MICFLPDSAALHAAANVGPGPEPRVPNVLPVTVAHTAIATLKWAHALTINLASDFDLDPRHLAPVDLDASRDHVAYFGYGAPTNVTVVHFDALTLDQAHT